ncbi:hypothetical protein [Cellulomonas sp. Marseille-Q8402]
MGAPWSPRTPGTPTAAGPARTAPGTAAVPAAAPSPARATPAPAPAAPASAPAPVDDQPEDDVPVPQWQSLLKAMAPAPTPEAEAEQTDPTGAMLHGLDADEEIDELEQPERLRRPLPFTWLQWIVLALVAFVLGFLIIFVANTATDAAGADVPAVAAGVLDAAPAP